MDLPPKPTEVELRILRVLWDLGPATVKEVHGRLTQDRNLAYTGVLRMLQVMHEKGLVLRDASSRSHIYRPVQSREATQRGLVNDLLEKAFAGSASDLVQAALASGPVSPGEKARIRELLGLEERP